ncbi:hypothetical protein MMC29_001035 [Sticta canariensis]|nr:hypothetical protein [Sticta canariensis]
MSRHSIPHVRRSLGERLREGFKPRSRDSSPSLSTGLMAANLPTASAAASSSPQAPSNPSLSHSLLADALKQLSGRDRATIEEHILSTTSDIDLALERALAAAKEKQRCCHEKRWTFTFAGQAVDLKNEADKVVHWLNRFKAVGDIAVQVDPVHAGLPWAGIRLLLEAAVSEANQMTSLLVGCETVLYMTNRLKAYMEFLNDLPVTLTRTNFESHMTTLYARIFRFLARAIQIYKTPSIRRAFNALWQENDVREFEQECDKLGRNVEIEARNCDRTLSVQDREHTKKLEQDLQKMLGELEKWHKIQHSLDRIEVKMDLNKLPYAKGAIFNSYEDDCIVCHRSTRADLLDQVKSWARQPNSKSIFWLNGMAGTGKSTISRTFAEWLTGPDRLGSVDLGASFFFKRGEGDRGSASLFFSTITRQLVQKIPELDARVAEAVTSDPLFFDRSLGEQFDKLIYQPLRTVNITTSSCWTFIVVVDALDECEKDRDIDVILKLWSQLPQISTVCIKLFLTSRPDRPIRLGFKNMSVGIHQDLILHDVPATTIQNDISAFLKDEFLEIRKKYNDDLPSSTSLDTDWPGDEVIQDLVNMAVPLFIVAATVCRFVGDSNFSPEERLKTILHFQKMGQLEQMERIYLPVLTQLPTTLSNRGDEEMLYQQFQVIVGSIVTLAEPLSKTSLADLLNIRQDTIALRLNPLHSILRVPADTETPVRTLHLSLGEFLLSDKVRHKPFGVNGPATHQMLFTKCLEFLSGSGGLRENLCDLEYPGKPRQEVEPTMINEHLSPVFQYACRYWVHHVQHSMVLIHDYDKVHVFLRKHFLHWLEALSLMNRIAEVIGQVGVLKSLVSANNSTQLSSFLEDARRIVLANQHIINIAPLQIYSSVMIFAPQTNVVRNICSQVPAWLRKYPVTPVTWSQELMKLEGHTRSVSAVAFSQDGLLLASGSGDQTIRLWNPTTGQEVQKLEGHTSLVRAVAFSQDGLLLASGSDDETVRLWDPTMGQEMRKLEGHTDWVKAVAFSQDGLLLASGSEDQTVRLWDPTTGQEAQKLEGHTNWVSAVAFSQDGLLLASGSEDQTIRLWDPTTGQEVQKLEGPTGQVSAVAFSPDGLLLASGSDDETIRLWDPTTGQEVRKLEGHTSLVMAVAFSPDGLLLASGSSDATVRLWDPTTGQEVRKLEGHTDWVLAVAFSQDGLLLASGSGDQTIRLWDPTTGQEVRKLEGHTDWVRAVAFSQDGLLLASGSYDQTVRLWDPTTGQEVQKLEGHTKSVEAVAFSPDGLLLASGSDDWTVRLWDLTTSQEVWKVENLSDITAISLIIDNKILTNRGAIIIDDESISGKTLKSSTGKLSMIKEKWIQQNDRNFLWIPQEYRGICSAFCGNTFAIGQYSGQVSFFQLDDT